MSRKAKVPIKLPQGTEVKIENGLVTVKGPKGQLSQQLTHGVVAAVEGDNLSVSLSEKSEKQFQGLYWSLLSNMVHGVNKGFEKSLEMIGVGFRAAVKGTLLDLQLGFSHPVELPIPEGIEVKVDKNVNIHLTGINKQQIGQFAADIRAKRPPEPYKGKGVRYKDEYVRRKAGKAGKK
ncbi:MAG: 50S ribosomal protein L6 [Chlamydiales bacterium]|nr:50S ribosomal protein L6 [Chlamydiales bacterium]MCH9635782.1 50S ribosomal protein L6 [Chlamydiales bacterium]MCH9703955.1 50S ribosomal protein L6 [Chlamydiota bacterium]